MSCASREVIYPIFIECMEWAEDDPYWESVFENLAYGKAPHGTYITRDNLCCAQKKNTFSYPIENKDSAEVYAEVYALLSEKAGLVSDAERLKRMAECEVADKENDWISIRRKNVKDMLVEQFVIRMRKTHNLSAKQGEELLGVINTGLMLRSIAPTDVHMENGIIDYIEHIEFSDGMFTVDKDLYDVEVELTADLDVTQTPLSKIWHKYVEELRKTIVCRRSE